MVTPVYQEAAWRFSLDGLPEWQPPRIPTLVISPHPDDETLGLGGLIAHLQANGVPITVLAVTDGENAYAGETGLGPVRDREQAAALAELGVAKQQIQRLRLTDSGLMGQQGALAEHLRLLIHPGMHVIAPWPGDFHPDHEACGRAAALVAALNGASLTFYFFWTWHRGTPATLAGLPLVRFPLDTHLLATRDRALQCHSSQLQHASGEPILPDYLLGPMQRPYEVFLPS